MFKSLDQCVAEAHASKGPKPYSVAIGDDRLTRLAELERFFDGPIPDVLRFERAPVVTAYNALASARWWVRQQIDAIRAGKQQPIDPEWMARLYRDLAGYRSAYRARQAELMRLLRDAETRLAAE